LAWQPDVVILVDYGGFNLRGAKFIKDANIPVFYYISPKIWAWNTGRVKKIKRLVDRMFVIFPFEVDFYARYDYPVQYAGNPLVDAIHDRPFKNETFNEFVQVNGLSGKPIIALVAGSRSQELKHVLPKMLTMVKHFPDHEFVIAGAPSMSDEDYAPYLQDVEAVNQATQQETLYDAKIMPKDLLTIVVSCTSPELAAPFNLTIASPSNLSIQYTTTQPVLQQYLVDNEGKISFPVLGALTVGGLTKKQAEQLIVDKLKPYMKENPIVTVRMVNYKISVIGEVARPGTFTISNEKVNLLEALAMAGDMTVYGLRDNVKLIREDANGKQQIVTLDLNNAETILSPYYWLQQNDIVYITPNKAKARNSDVGNSTSLWFSATSILVSVVSLLVNILK